MEKVKYLKVLDNENLFPAGVYSIQDIYKIVFENIKIPKCDFENRSDKKFPLWKNKIHGALYGISNRKKPRIKYFKNKKLYYFN